MFEEQTEQILENRSLGRDFRSWKADFFIVALVRKREKFDLQPRISLEMLENLCQSTHSFRADAHQRAWTKFGAEPKVPAQTNAIKRFLPTFSLKK